MILVRAASRLLVGHHGLIYKLSIHYAGQVFCTSYGAILAILGLLNIFVDKTAQNSGQTGWSQNSNTLA
jgi:hypothetical protein